MSQEDDDDFAAAWEALPEFIVSQLRVGQVLSESDVKAIQAVLEQLNTKENLEVEAFHEGRLSGFREIGGEDLVTSVQLKDAEKTARFVRAAMDRMFSKSQMTRQ